MNIIKGILLLVAKVLLISGFAFHPAFVRTILYFRPDSFPFLSPRKRFLADRTDFRREIIFGNAFSVHKTEYYFTTSGFMSR